MPQEPINSLIQDISVKGEKISTVKDSQGKLSVSMDFNKGKGFRSPSTGSWVSTRSSPISMST